MKRTWSNFANSTTFRTYELDLDKVESIDDCKKILKFLCNLTMKPMPEGVEYSGFGDVEEYFKR